MTNQLQLFSVVFFLTSRFRFQGRAPPVVLAWPLFRPLLGPSSTFYWQPFRPLYGEMVVSPKQIGLLLLEDRRMDTKKQKQPVATQKILITTKFPSRQNWGERVWNQSFFCKITVTLYKGNPYCCTEVTTYIPIRDS